MHRPHRPTSAWPTAVATLLVLTLFGWCLYLVTDRMCAWTFDERRANAVVRGELRADPLSLIDARAQALSAFSAATLEGSADDVWLVDFFYTRCPSVCQALGSEFFRMQEQLRADSRHAITVPGQGRVRLLSISLDPEHDTPQALAAYASRHRADPLVWRLATPAEPEQGRALMRRLGVIAIPDGMGGFVHNAGIHVMTSDGRLLQIAELGAWEQALKHAQSIVDANACRAAP